MRTNMMKLVGAVVIVGLGALVGCGSDDEGGTGGGSTGTGGGGGGTTATTTSASSATTTGAGGAGGGMGATQACKDCFATVFVGGSACNDAVQACDADPACDTWKDCGESCFNANDTVACYEACDAAHPHDAALSQPLIDCLCDSCDSDCVATCAGN
jgi:hypothetical protein